MISPVRLDAYRNRASSSRMTVVRLFLTQRSFRPVATLRLWQRFEHVPGLRQLSALVHRVACQLAAVDLPPNTRIAPGFILTHGWGTVINGGAVIGRNVTIMHGVTIGRGDRIDASGERVSGFPVIEDDVWIGPGAVIVGGVTIGRGSRIMANAVVTSDIAPHSMVFVGPCEIKPDARPDVVNPI